MLIQPNKVFLCLTLYLIHKYGSSQYFIGGSDNDKPILSPSAADVTFVQCTIKQKITEIIENLSCWYSLESSR